jgi:hypothetical protein
LTAEDLGEYAMDYYPQVQAFPAKADGRRIPFVVKESSQ